MTHTTQLERQNLTLTEVLMDYVSTNYGIPTWETIMDTPVESHTLRKYYTQYGDMVFKDIVDSLSGLVNRSVFVLLNEFLDHLDSQ